MSDPVIIASGTTYERAAIERWFSQGNKICPLTGEKQEHTRVVPNQALRQLIVDWCASQGLELRAGLVVERDDGAGEDRGAADSSAESPAPTVTGERSAEERGGRERRQSKPPMQPIAEAGPPEAANGGGREAASGHAADERKGSRGSTSDNVWQMLQQGLAGGSNGTGSEGTKAKPKKSGGGLRRTASLQPAMRPLQAHGQQEQQPQRNRGIGAAIGLAKDFYAALDRALADDAAGPAKERRDGRDGGERGRAPAGPSGGAAKAAAGQRAGRALRSVGPSSAGTAPLGSDGSSAADRGARAGKAAAAAARRAGGGPSSSVGTAEAEGSQQDAQRPQKTAAVGAAGAAARQAALRRSGSLQPAGRGSVSADEFLAAVTSLKEERERGRRDAGRQPAAAAGPAQAAAKKAGGSAAQQQAAARRPSAQPPSVSPGAAGAQLAAAGQAQPADTAAGDSPGALPSASSPPSAPALQRAAPAPPSPLGPTASSSRSHGGSSARQMQPKAGATAGNAAATATPSPNSSSNSSSPAAAGGGMLRGLAGSLRRGIRRATSMAPKEVAAPSGETFAEVVAELKGAGEEGGEGRRKDAAGDAAASQPNSAVSTHERPATKEQQVASSPPLQPVRIRSPLRQQQQQPPPPPAAGRSPLQSPDRSPRKSPARQPMGLQQAGRGAQPATAAVGGGATRLLAAAGAAPPAPAAGAGQAAAASAAGGHRASPRRFPTSSSDRGPGSASERLASSALSLTVASGSGSGSDTTGTGTATSSSTATTTSSEEGFGSWVGGDALGQAIRGAIQEEEEAEAAPAAVRSMTVGRHQGTRGQRRGAASGAGRDAVDGQGQGRKGMGAEGEGRPLKAGGLRGSASAASLSESGLRRSTSAHQAEILRWREEVTAALDASDSEEESGGGGAAGGRREAGGRIPAASPSKLSAASRAPSTAQQPRRSAPQASPGESRQPILHSASLDRSSARRLPSLAAAAEEGASSDGSWEAALVSPGSNGSRTAGAPAAEAQLRGRSEGEGATLARRQQALALSVGGRAAAQLAAAVRMSPRSPGRSARASTPPPSSPRGAPSSIASALPAGPGSRCVAEVLPLLRALGSGSEAQQEEAVGAIRVHLKSRPLFKLRFIAAGGVPALVDLLHCGGAGVRESTMAVLQTVAQVPGGAAIISSVGGIGQIASALVSGTPATKEAAASALFSLSVDRDALSVLKASGAVPPLVAMLQNGSTQGRKDASLVLFNLSRDSACAAEIVAAGAVPVLIGLLEDAEEGMEEKAMAVVANLSRLREGCRQLVECGAVRVLVRRVLQRGTQRSQEDATMALLMLARTCPDTAEEMRELGTVAALREVLVGGSERAKSKAQALTNLLERGEDDGSFGVDLVSPM